MTEQEALTRWCPFARVATSHAEGRSINRVGSESGQPELIKEADCIGSACMAWRWLGTEVQHFPPGKTPEGDGWIEGEMWRDGRYRVWERRGFAGYCGLAGKP